MFSRDAGTYTVVAKNVGGEGRTACMLTLEGSYPLSGAGPPMAPRFTQPLQNRAVQEGARARLDCVVVASPEPEVTQQNCLSKRDFYCSLVYKIETKLVVQLVSVHGDLGNQQPDLIVPTKNIITTAFAHFYNTIDDNVVCKHFSLVVVVVGDLVPQRASGEGIEGLPAAV